MSAATKVTIAVAILFAAVLGIYYGFSGAARDGIEPPPDALAQNPLPQPETPPAVPDRAAATSAPPPAAPASAAGTGGILASDALRAVPDDAGIGPAPAPGPAVLPPREEVWVVRAPSLAEPVAPAAATTALGYRDYFVLDGDSLWLIADAQLGDPLRWRQIAEANPGVNPDRLLPGTSLRIPMSGNGTLNLNHGAAVVPPPAAAPSGSTLHAIRPGDTLSEIARTYYGDPARWRPIYNANRTAIGRDPDRLRVGLRLVIPPLVTPTRAPPTRAAPPAAPPQ